MMRALLTALICIGFMPALAAQDGKSSGEVDPSTLRLLIGDELLAEFSGKTRIGVYSGRSSIFGKNSFVETTHADGTATYREEDIETNGKWIASGDRVCFNYVNDPGRLYCFRKFKSGTCVYSYSMKNSTVTGPKNPNMWSSKSVIKGDVSTCDEVLG